MDKTADGLMDGWMAGYLDGWKASPPRGKLE